VLGTEVVVVVGAVAAGVASGLLAETSVDAGAASAALSAWAAQMAVAASSTAHTLSDDTKLDDTFIANPPTKWHCAPIAPWGSILCGGQFTRANGQFHP
jgi:hypothetical protein